MRAQFRKLSIVVPVIALVILTSLSSNVQAGPISPIAASTGSGKVAPSPIPPTKVLPTKVPVVAAPVVNCPSGITAIVAAKATAAPTTAATSAATTAATKAATTAATIAATTAATPAATSAATKAATAAATLEATKPAVAAPSILASKGCLQLTSLTGDTEAPDGGDPDGKGTAIIAIDSAKSELCYQLNVENITLPAAAAHIHKGAVGVAGDVVVAFKAPNADGVASDCIEKVNAALLKDILDNPGNYYVNVHTAKYPKGAIRGQLASAVALSGAGEVTKVDPKGAGVAAITADVANGQLCYDLYVEGITLPATASHIHKGAAGVDGDVVIPFKGAPGAKGRLNACVNGIDAALLKDILANPANYYVNVHTSDAPKGAVRGQLGVKK